MQMYLLWAVNEYLGTAQNHAEQTGEGAICLLVTISFQFYKRPNHTVHIFMFIPSK